MEKGYVGDEFANSAIGSSVTSVKILEIYPSMENSPFCVWFSGF